MADGPTHDCLHVCCDERHDPFTPPGRNWSCVLDAADIQEVAELGEEVPRG